MPTRIVDAAGVLRIEARSKALIFTRVVAILWAAGWLALEASVFLDWIRSGWSPVAIVMVVWTITGPFAFLAIVWAAVGKPEIVTVSGRTLEVWRGIGPYQASDRRRLRRHHILLGSRCGAARLRYRRTHIRVRLVAR